MTALQALAHRLDAGLARLRRPSSPDAAHWPAHTRLIDTAVGELRVLDSGGDKPVVLFAPDGPCVIEHYEKLIGLLSPRHRVVCLDLPGFGLSYARGDYRHELRQGADALLGVMDALNIQRATLALSCVNGFYAMAAAKLAPQRVERLVLTQTPGMDAMRNWTSRIVPRPIRIPIVGQLLNHATRLRASHGWFNVALADRALRPQFIHHSDECLRHGGCWSLAGVVQGMSAVDGEEPLLKDIRVPTTLVWGTKDRSHKPTDPASLKRHVPDVKIVTVDVGHFADLEAPELYAKILLG